MTIASVVIDKPALFDLFNLEAALVWYPTEERIGTGGPLQ
ncbi:zinc metalloprotease [Aspergillus luchuensis]|uniref:Zinc metalloprotease n=1 Tax=Aspergillus kawachii TaxID=1069201 RepID=A0A146FHB1_ASPKA|nr:zinc metalloprotease [Aspergillus luchuensis]